MTAPTAAQAVVDVVFPVQGRALPQDHAEGLQQALCALMPWLATDPGVGIHPVKLVHGNETTALLSQRTRLLLRVAAQRADELQALAGLELSVHGHTLRLGEPHVRDLLAHATLYAYKVAAASADEEAFMATVARELAQLGVAGARVCGKHQRAAASSRVQDSFSLMLHELQPEQALALQRHGLGPHRLLGCGIFVPHKSAAAVGS